MTEALSERCETCGDTATQWDYDQRMCFCDRHVQQGDFTVPIENRQEPPPVEALAISAWGHGHRIDAGDTEPAANLLATLEAARALDASIDALRAELAAQCASTDKLALENAALGSVIERELTAVKAERDRLREALELALDFMKGHAPHSAQYEIQQARAALEGR